MKRNSNTKQLSNQFKSIVRIHFWHWILMTCICFSDASSDMAYMNYSKFFQVTIDLLIYIKKYFKFEIWEAIFKKVDLLKLYMYVCVIVSQHWHFVSIHFPLFFSMPKPSSYSTGKRILGTVSLCDVKFFNFWMIMIFLSLKIIQFEKLIPIDMFLEVGGEL